MFGVLLVVGRGTSQVFELLVNGCCFPYTLNFCSQTPKQKVCFDFLFINLLDLLMKLIIFA